MTISETLKAEITKAIGLKSAGLRINLRKPLDFQSNCLYDVWTDNGHFIAKEYLQPDELETAPLREYKALRLLSSLDIAPQPIFFEPSLGPIVVYQYMEGEMWDRRSVKAADLSKLLEVWLKVNAVPADWVSRGYERSLQGIEHEFLHHFKTYLEWAAVEFPPGKLAADMCLRLLESRHDVIQVLSDETPLLCFCRADPRFANVIQRPNGQLGMVDWEDSGLRDPARDVADVITHPNQEDLVSWEEWQAFVAPYLEMRSKIDSTISQRTHLYLAIFPIFWLTLIIKRGIKLASSGQLAGWTINGLPGNVRLRRYLARALAWPDMDYRSAHESLEAVLFFPDGYSR
jgi:hypothetical protein